MSKNKKQEFQLNFAKTNDGQEIYYEVRGNEKGPIVLFQSGYMGVIQAWDDLIKILEKDYKCILHDNRGYGRSSSPDDKKYYSLERHAEDIKNLLEHLQINEPIYLISHSAGCFIVSCFAAKYPQLTKRIINVSGLITGFVKIGNTGLNNENDFKNALLNPSQRASFFNNLGLKLEIAQEACKWSFNVMIYNANCLILNKDCMKYYGQINCEVLLINGEKDIFFVPDQNGQPNVKKGKALFINNVNHFPQYEDSKKTAELIKKNLEVNPLDSLKSFF
jgi:pimeloyl-ACP methyl ester carboxylesterase